MTNNNCKYYDDVLDCCKLYSDWIFPMPNIQPCYKNRCPKYKPIKEVKTILKGGEG